MFFVEIRSVNVVSSADFRAKLLLLCYVCRELYSNNISGIIPNELGNLTNLVSLDLYMNHLTGPIPDSLGNLQKLRFLYELHLPAFRFDFVKFL